MRGFGYHARSEAVCCRFGLRALAALLLRKADVPTSVAIGLVVLGGVLVLVAILGGNFKIFGAEVTVGKLRMSLRLLAGVSRQSKYSPA